MTLDQLTETIEKLQTCSAKAIVVEVIQRIPDMDACWILRSHRVNNYGYPQLMIGNKHWLVSRLVLEIVTGTPLGKLTASHLCSTGTRDNRACINPTHLVGETMRENLRRKAGLNNKNH